MRESRRALVGRLLTGVALVAGGPGLLAGCGILIDDVTIDPYADWRPAALVDRLAQEAGGLRDAFRDFMGRVPLGERGRYSSLETEVSALVSATGSLQDDLRYRSGAFGRQLEQVEYRTLVIGDRLPGRPEAGQVRTRFRYVRSAVVDVRSQYQSVGATSEGLYRAQDSRAGTATVKLPGPPDTGFDASSEIEFVDRGLKDVVAAWDRAPARRGSTSWAASLTRELATIRQLVTGELIFVNATRAAEVKAAARKVTPAAERVTTLVDEHELDLPADLVRHWRGTAGWLSGLAQP